MPHCPTCSYNLVFLERRLRYKCAKCGRAFLQKFVESRDFRLWNRQLRSFGMRKLLSEVGQIEVEKQKKREVKELNKISRGLRFLFAGRGRPASASSEERRVREVEYNRKWRENNPEKVKILRRRYLEKHREQRYSYLKAWRVSNLDKFRLNQRLAHWRRKQSEMTLEQLKLEGDQETRSKYIKNLA